MKIFSFFYKYNKRFSFVFVCLTIVSGLLSGAVVAFINVLISALLKGEVDGTTSQMNDIILFSILVGGNLLLDRQLSVAATKYTVRMVHNIRMQIIQKLKKIEYRNFEKIGDEHIFTILIRDTTVISSGAYLVVRFFSSIITILVCLVYMFLIFPFGLLLTLIIVGLGLSVYLLRQKSIMKDLSRARDLESIFFSQIQDLVKGFKELKLSHTKRDDLYNNYIYKVSDEAKELRSKSLIKYTNNNLIGSVFFYIFTGVIIFYFPTIIGDNTKVYTFLLLVIYILGPISALADMVPSITGINIAIDQVDRLEVNIMTIGDEKSAQIEQSSSKELLFSTIVFKDVYFSYQTEEDELEENGEEMFTIGPINIEIEQGKSHLVFGKNGEGKTTFIKILTGLYKPKSGQILVDGVVLKDENYDSFRNLYSVIYSDFYLFENSYGLSNHSTERINELLALMKIEHKVEFMDGKFTSFKLSTGQRKRMALVLTILEDKPIIVLDEWAAEQDPEFRSFFYRKVIPDLEKNGKTVIMISHDEQYFEIAERLYKLDKGEINKTSKSELHFLKN